MTKLVLRPDNNNPRVITRSMILTSIFPPETIQTTFLSLQGILSNKTAATKLVCYRNELLSLLGRIRIKEKPAKELFDEFENLQSSIHEVYQDAPNTTNRAVAKAGKSINESRDGTYSDEEIDRLLPDTLKRRNIK